MPTSVSKIEQAEELERLLDEWEQQRKQQEQQQEQNESKQEEPPQFPELGNSEPKYEPPPQPRFQPVESRPHQSQLTDDDRKMIALIANKLAERTGKSPEILQIILEEILNEDKKTLKVLHDYFTVAKMLSSSGNVSQKVGDMTNANLLKLTGQKLAEKIAGSGVDDTTELMRLAMLMKILDMDKTESKEQQELTTYKYPLIDPNTGQPILDANGNPVYVEYKLPAGMPPMLPFMNQPMINRRNEREEELKKELEELRSEMRKLLEEKREQEMKAMINSLQSKLEEMERRLEELKNYGGGGGVGQTGDLRSMVEQINTLKEVLSQLGYRVEEPKKEREEKREVDPIIELQRKKEEKSYELWTKHIGPALGDLIRNPDKIADMVEKLMSLFGSGRRVKYPTYPTPQAMAPTMIQAHTGPPRLEDMIKKVKNEGGK